MSGQLTYLTGDATQPADRPAVIAHICNDVGGWGAGFVLALSAKWSEPQEWYAKWHREGEDFAPGVTQVVLVGPGLYVANMIAQHDVVARNGRPPIRYDALRDALIDLDEKVAPETTVHMPRIGCGLAGGKWDRVSAIIDETLIAAGREVFVYDKT